MKLKQLIYGIATFIPGVSRCRSRGPGETASARYCYSVWLRHLVRAKNNGLNSNPKAVAELGPGGSLGMGLAALLSGCDKYFAFDIVEHANTAINIKVFEELVALYRSKADIPGEDEFPNIKPSLEGYRFPYDILDRNRLLNALEPSRIQKIRDSIQYSERNDSLIKYIVPWNDVNILMGESVDMIFSQAVLEHVDDLRSVYRSMHLWLVPTGYISHQIDFKCHGTADEWNGHWKYSDFMWKLIKGKRPYLLNREPHSAHISILNEEGYKIVCDKKIKSESTLNRNRLASRFKFILDDDLTCSGAFIQARK